MTYNARSSLVPCQTRSSSSVGGTATIQPCARHGGDYSLNDVAGVFTKSLDLAGQACGAPRGASCPQPIGLLNYRFTPAVQLVMIVIGDLRVSSCTTFTRNRWPSAVTS